MPSVLPLDELLFYLIFFAYIYSFPFLVCEDMEGFKNWLEMGFKEQMAEWIAKHPEATLEEAFVAGWFACTEAWCRGKREKMEQIVELMKEIIR